MGWGFLTVVMGTVLSIGVSPALGAEPDGLWEVAWFNCDYGGLNDFVLFPTGSPVCPSDNCDEPCWENLLIEKSRSQPGISWDVTDEGRIHIGYDRDMQVRASIWVCVPAPVTIPADAVKNGWLWTGSGCGAALQPGWNLIQCTSYDQTAGSQFDFNFDLAAVATAFGSRPMGECAQMTCPASTARVRRVSVETWGAGTEHLSASGRYVVFRGQGGMYFHDRDADGNGVLDEPGGIGSERLFEDGYFTFPRVSGDGRFVAYSGTCDFAGCLDVFLLDRQTGATQKVSEGYTSTHGTPSASIDAQIRSIAFESSLPGQRQQVYVHDRERGTTVQVSINDSGDSANGSSGQCALSANGRFVAFNSGSTNLGVAGSIWRVYVHDRDFDQDGLFDEREIEPRSFRTVAIAPGESGAPTISADGRFVAYQRYTSPRQIFVHDRDPDGNCIFDEPGLVSDWMVSIDDQGNPGNGNSGDGGGGIAISADGRFVAFTSRATNLFGGPTSPYQQVLLHDRDADGNGNFEKEPGRFSTIILSLDPLGRPASSDCQRVSMSDYGCSVAFWGPTDLDPDDPGGVGVYVWNQSAIPSTPCSAPDPVNAGKIGADVLVEWTDVCKDEIAFIVERQIDGGVWGDLWHTPSEAIKFLDTTLPARWSLACYRVSAVNRAGLTTSSVACIRRPGDSNGDGIVDLSDIVHVLGCLFLNGEDCPPDSSFDDINCDGGVDLSDAIYLLFFLFLVGPAPGSCV